MGCGQGDNPSSLNWKAFMDILNRAIRMKTGIKPFYIRDTKGILHRIKPIVFADDIRNQTVDGIELQKEADVICAFCHVFGLRQNETKTEMLIQNYGGEKDIKEQTHIKLGTMNMNKEISIKTIMLQHEGFDKHLGIIHDNKRNGISTLKDEVRTGVTEDCKRVIEKKDNRMSDKINCVNTIVLPRVTYKLRNSSLSLREMEEITSRISKAYRIICKTSPTFPNGLIYLPEKWAGLGLKRVSDVTNNQKKSHLFRKTINEGSTKNALLAMIDIACRERNNETKPGMINHIDGSIKVKDKLWMNSLIEYANEVDVNLTIGGDYHNNSESWPEDKLERARDGKGQHFNIDTMTIKRGRWEKPSSKFEEYEEYSEEKLSINYRHQLKHDQSYIVNEQVMEVLGKHSNDDMPDLEIRIWESIDGKAIKRGQ